MNCTVLNRWLTCATLCLVAAGCASRTPVQQSTSPLRVLDSTSGGQVTSVSDIFPLQMGVRRYQHWEVDGLNAKALRTVERSLAPSREFQSHFVQDEVGARQEYLSLDDAGNLVLNAVVELDDKAISLFDPPLTVAFAQHAPGELKRAESKMRVVDLNDRQKQREAGTAVRTIRYVGDEQIRTPLGEFRARKFEIHFEAKLKMATADEHTTWWVTADRGLVAEQNHEQIKILGLAGATTKRMLTLVDSAAAVPIDLKAPPAAPISP